MSEFQVVGSFVYEIDQEDCEVLMLGDARHLALKAKELVKLIRLADTCQVNYNKVFQLLEDISLSVEKVDKYAIKAVHIRDNYQESNVHPMP